MSNVHEQHDMEALKSWWKSNGAATLIGVGVVVAGMLGWQLYQDQVKTSSETASARFEVLQSKTGQFSEAVIDAKQLLVDEPKSPYATGAAFLLAKHAIEQQDWENAQMHLNWVLKHSNQSHWQSLAALRLARVYIETEQSEQAINLLNQRTAQMSSAFKGMADYLRGLALLAQDNPTAAQQAFLQAKNNPEAASSINSLAQIWIDDLGQVAP